MGDFDSDGYEDALVVLYNVTKYEWDFKIFDCLIKYIYFDS